MQMAMANPGSDAGNRTSSEDYVEAEVCNNGRFMARNSGAPDVQVFYEGNESEANIVCNKDHSKYILFKEFGMHHLPVQYQKGNIFEMIQLIGDLTVRLKVLKTSPARPEFYPGTETPYPFHGVKNAKIVRTGTGHVFEVLRFMQDESNQCCQCKKCQISTDPSAVWAEVHVSTSTHVVFDELEARNTKCSFSFLNSSKAYEIGGWWLRQNDFKTDKCTLVCVTCDMELSAMLEKNVQLYEDVSEEVLENYMMSEDNPTSTFIVSHPHGGPKKVSIGNWTKRERQFDLDENNQKKKSQYTVYHYDTSTCPGSSGARVISFGKKTSFFNHSHSGAGAYGNFSSACCDPPEPTEDEMMQVIMNMLGHPKTVEEMVRALDDRIAKLPFEK